jgi:UDP-glucose 4-epimerase
MKNIVITGGFGFIGKKLTDHLINNNNVIILEHPDAIKPDSFPDVEVLPFDILSEDKNKFPGIENCDALIHLAAQSSGPRSFSIPEIDIKLNVLGTLNTINLCLKNNIEKILFASSFVVYGDHPEKESLDEETCCQPKSVYAGSKLAAEHLLKNYAGQKGIHWNSLRMFNVYGPGQDITKPDQGVVGIFLNMLLKSNTIDIKGSLDRFRDLVFVDDVVAAWSLCLEKGKKNRAYNVGSGQKITYHELILKIAEILGKKDQLNINQLDGTPGDLMGCFADTRLAKRDFGFDSKVDIQSGLEKMINSVLNSL